MSAHLTGQYRITLFDRLVARLRTVTAESFTQALQIGAARKEASAIRSLSVGCSTTRSIRTSSATT